jgi:peptidoglycan hydrolase-like protein with peptidoglycan-binding domain
MAKINLEELLGGLQEAALIVLGIQERQHINTLSKYFTPDGIPFTKTFIIGDKEVSIPLYILADHSSMGLEEMDINFDIRLLASDDRTPSSLKEDILPIFKKIEDQTIRGVQGALCKLGEPYASMLGNTGSNKNGVDGVVGPKCKSALIRYQKSKKLEETGEVDDATCKSLGVSTASEYTHTVTNISVDSNAPNSDNKAGMATVKVRFKKDEKPEAVSRLVEMLIQKLDDSGHIDKTK